MKSDPPTPCFDIVLCKLSQNCLFIQIHYQTDLNILYTRQCQVCKEFGPTHMHHIIPRSYLGAHCKSNLIELCPKCHKIMEDDEITLKGKYFYKGIKKKNKILRKLYVNNITIQPMLESKNYEKFDLVIRKHLAIDSAIKNLIKRKQIQRLNHFMVCWNVEGIIQTSKEFNLP
jgi:hypothetical protein